MYIFFPYRFSILCTYLIFNLWAWIFRSSHQNVTLEHFFWVQLTRSSLSFEIFYECFNHHLRKSKNPQGKLFLTEWVCMSNVVAWNSLLKPHENLGIFWRIIAAASGMNFEPILPLLLHSLVLYIHVVVHRYVPLCYYYATTMAHWSHFV